MLRPSRSCSLTGAWPASPGGTEPCPGSTASGGNFHLAEGTGHAGLWGSRGCSSGSEWLGYFLMVCLPLAVFCSLLLPVQQWWTCRVSTAGGACEEACINLQPWVCPMSVLKHRYQRNIGGAVGVWALSTKILSRQ